MNLDVVCDELRDLQRQRVVAIKSKNMADNRLVAVVAGSEGYHSGLAEATRKKMFAKARKIIKDVVAKKISHLYAEIIEPSWYSINRLELLNSSLEKEMRKRAELLPVAKWFALPDRRGINLLTLATLVGEAGNISNYPNPGKLWKRFGCAPHSFAGKTLMGATWRWKSEGELTKDEWIKFGYSKRRRSIVYVIGENIVKQNKGVYRQRYDTAKEQSKTTHPEWWICRKCGGGSKTKTGKKCDDCKGTGRAAMRGHRHGMLLATKLFLKELWIEWHKEQESTYRL